MKLFYFMVLLLFGDIADGFDNSSEEQEEEDEEEEANQIENFLDNTEMESAVSDTILRTLSEQHICNVTKCVQDEIIALIIKLSDSNDLEIKNMCPELSEFASDNNVKNIYKRAERKYMDSISSPFAGVTKTYNLGDFDMTFVKMNTTELRLIQISAPKLCGDDPPIILFIPTEPFWNDAVEQLKVGVVAHPSAQLFINDLHPALEFEIIHMGTDGHEIKNLSNRLVINFTVNGSEIIPVPNDELPLDVFVPTEPFLNVSDEQCKVGILTYPSAEELMAKGIRVEIVERELMDFSNRLVINFTLNNGEIIPGNQTLSCQFYDENENTWNDTGFFTDLDNFDSSKTGNCSYDQTTPFTVLLVYMALPNQHQLKNLSCINDPAKRNENFFFDKSTKLEIAEKRTRVHCNCRASQCSAECTSVNLTTNKTAVNKISVVENNSVTAQSNTLVVNISEQEITSNVTKCDLDEIMALISNSSNSSDLKDLRRLRQIKKMCNEFIANDSNLKNAYIRAEKKYIHTLITLPFNGTTKNYEEEEFNMTVVNMCRMNPTNPRLVEIPAPKVPDDDLSLDVFVPTEPFSNVSGNQCKVGIVTYRVANQFMSQNNSYLGFETKVVRVETVERELKDLSRPLVINFTVNNHETIPENQTLSCQFYDENEHKWKDKGAETNFNNRSIVTCSYVHMTPFAVLWISVPTSDPQPTNLSCDSAKRIENFFFYNSTTLEIAENLTTVHCNWGASQCYAECTSVNLTTNLMGVNISVAENQSITAQSKMFVFSISEQEITCNVTKCDLDEIKASINYSSNSNDLKDLRRPIHMKKMCNEFFANENNFKNASIRAEKKYIQPLITLPFNETTKNYEEEEFNMTVVNMCRMNTTNPRLVEIPAPKISVPTSDPQPTNLSCVNDSAKRIENFFFYNSTTLEIAENLTTVHCNWGASQCYAECTSVNLTTNLMGVNISVAENQSITAQSKMFVFSISEQEITCNVTKCDLDEIKASINYSSNSNDLKDLRRPIHMKKMCNEFFANESNFKNASIRAEKKYIHALITLPFNGTTKNYEEEEFNMTVVNMCKMNPTNPRLVEIPAPKVPDDDLSLDVFVPTEPFSNVSGNQCKVGIVTYRVADQFKSQNNSYLGFETKVVRVETVERELKDLSRPLVINFTVNNHETIPENQILSCQFYDENEHKWKDKGAETSFNNRSIVTCSYDHMTPFAVLRISVPTSDPQPTNLSCVNDSAKRIENFFFYNSTTLEIAENLTTVHCNWGASQCYAECASVNLTTNLMGVNISVAENQSITAQSKMFVFSITLGEQEITCNVTKCDLDEIKASINYSSNSNDLKDLRRPIHMKKMCNEFFANESNFKNAYIRAEKKYIHALITLPFNETTKNYEEEEFNMTVVNMCRMNTTNPRLVEIPAPKVPDDDLSLDVFVPTEPFSNVSKNQCKVGIVTYRVADQFKSQNNSYLGFETKVVRVETVERELKDLSRPLVINFTVNNREMIPENQTLSCQFYDENEHKWKDKGAETNFSNRNIVTCSYDHMTPFAVLRISVPTSDSQPTNLSCVNGSAKRIENFFFYNSTTLEIAENLTTVHCNWGASQCYAECTSVNLTTNLMGVNISVAENQSITAHSKMFVFNISEQEITCNVTECVSVEINPLINYSSNSNDLKDLRRPIHMKKMCNKLFATDPEFKRIYINAEKKFIHAFITLPFNETTKNYEEEEFNMTVVKMDMMNPTNAGLVEITAPKVPDDDLSLDVFVPTEPFSEVSKNQCKVGIVTYRVADQFLPQNNSLKLKTKVVRVETVERELKNLSRPLVINFTVNIEKIHENQTLSCQFYDEKEHNWKDTGSSTNLDNFNKRDTVTCLYDHMTPFAVLLVDMNTTQIDSQQWKILSYITYIGCALSSFFSMVTIFLHIFMKSPKSYSVQQNVHVSLSVAIFLLNTSFLFTEWGATWSQEGACVFIAVMIQYGLLSCFSWMAVEAIHLYLLLIKVFNTYIKYYIVKLSLFGWGVPAVLVGGSLCVYKQVYGTTQIKLSNNETMKICWITDPHFLYGMNITYFCLMFLFNTCVLVAVTRQIFKLQRLDVKSRKFPSCKDICTVVGLTFLLGMTWGLVFFTSGYTNYPILYLFCIFNSLQGLLLFLWFYGTLKKNRQTMAQTKPQTSSSSLQQ